MDNTYKESPNIVKIVFSDEHGEDTRFVVNKTIDDAVNAFEEGIDKHDYQDKPKQKRKRRTKAELAAEKVTEEAVEKVESHEPNPEQPGRKKKKEVAWV